MRSADGQRTSFILHFKSLCRHLLWLVINNINISTDQRAEQQSPITLTDILFFFFETLGKPQS